ncbi:ABC transporter substrate-binding protein, partial [Pseudomonas syringae group genomosp. 7]|uniref:ABC transporter substrate-binding protein n=1 Tax=Pseudomonas syringae group genomosp. 7 TaxID=251699 RepID=UPI00376F8134
VPTAPQTLVIPLKNTTASFLSHLPLPTVSNLSEKAIKSMGEESYGEQPVCSGAFTVKLWGRGERVILAKNPNLWEAPIVKLYGVEWSSVPDDIARPLMV